jgi:hypothetical protein
MVSTARPPLAGLPDLVQDAPTVFIGCAFIGKGSMRRATVEHRPRPEVPGQCDADTPGECDDGAVADRCTHQQSPQRVDDRREGLVLSEPADPAGHRVQGDERTADEWQEELYASRLPQGWKPSESTSAFTQAHARGRRSTRAISVEHPVTEVPRARLRTVPASGATTARLLGQDPASKPTTVFSETRACMPRVHARIVIGLGPRRTPAGTPVAPQDLWDDRRCDECGRHTG